MASNELRNNNPPKHRLHVVPAAYLIMRQNRKILLSKRANTGYMDGYYSLPAGHLDGAETPEQAAVREGLEETGVIIDAKSLIFAHVRYRVAKESDYERVDFFFNCPEWDGEIKNMEPEKCDGLEWFDESDLPDNIVPDVAEVLSAIVGSVSYTTSNFN